MSHLFGWCMDGHHSSCPGAILTVSANNVKTIVCACERCNHRTPVEPSATGGTGDQTTGPLTPEENAA